MIGLGWDGIMPYRYRKTVFLKDRNRLNVDKVKYRIKIRVMMAITMLLLSTLSFVLIIDCVKATGFPPSISDPSPSNGTTNQSLNPTLFITVNDSEGDLMNITWFSNFSGSWVAFGTNTSCNNGTYLQTNSNFSSYGITYWWNVTVNDGTANTSATYQFNTIGMPNETYVDDDFNESTPGWGYNKFDNIQDGIFAVAINGTVYVYNGTYMEDNILLGSPIDDKTGVTLVAESQNAIIDANYNDSTIFIFANDSTVDGFTIIGGDDCGIWVNADNVTIRNNNITECNHGVMSEDSESGINATNLTIENNTIYNNDLCGIVFKDNPYNIEILNNSINENGDDGIEMWDTPHIILISGNTFEGNEGEGAIWMIEYENNITISENDFTNNSFYAIFMGGETPYNVYSYLNNFINNSNVINDEGSNSWDNGTYGNYWDTYDEPGEGAWDNDSNGIADAPYVIDGDSQDNYPLMNPWDGMPLEQAPTVITNDSTGVEETNATLKGYLQDDGMESNIVRFEYGTTTDYGTNTSNQTKSTGQTFTANISNLTRGQLYHFRTYANNTVGSSTGSDKTFLTKPNSPSGLMATASSTSQIDLTWTKGNGANITYIVRKTDSYPSSRADGTLVYNGTGTNCSNTELSPSTKYYYRAWSYTYWDSLQQWSDDYNSISCTTKSGDGGGAPPSLPPRLGDEEEPSTTKEQIEELFNITLLLNFSAYDTDEDGIVDIFSDPNDILESERYVILNDNASFLISVYNDLDKLFIWDAEADTITLVTHTLGEITADIKDNKNKTRIVSIIIEKTDWVYIEVTDQYPSYPLLNVQTSDGRNISTDMIWREQEKIFVLDDPETEYQFVYSSKKKGFLFDVLLELTPTSVDVGEDINALITLINVGEPGLVNATVVYTLYKGTEIIWTEEENVSVLGQIAFNKTLSTEGLSSGEYIYEVVHYYGDNQTASAQKLFTIFPSAHPVGVQNRTPTIIIVLLAVFLFWYFKLRK